ncbi:MULTISPECIES: CarD family transcriptional regulator [Alteribacter]|uniref:CarD family transcriptional regulator n=1 Tax=Alteribacter keqinensis TaxID=2483800 RepID=A0A3M7TTD3_9BACI|nr:MULTISPECIES: CarD family transcriptional regulator [Alteribacter]MBM7097084.1 CarD family transcriptional regulator [Alteribacter salitolerans]RNA68888.1 CarD family transcriptional regulator [Alteribacter keqinensis]
MFKVGDHVVYPYHGAGTIKDMEEKDILGEKINYFVVFFPLNHVTLMLPEGRVKESGLRKVIETSKVDELASALSQPDLNASKKEAARPYSKENETLLKTGCIMDAASVIANLTSKEGERTNGLHMEDRKNMDRAKQFIASELMLVNDISEEEAYEFIMKNSQGA